MRFIRKNGRVIPIRDKNESKQIHAGKVWAAGVGANVGAFVGGKQFSKAIADNLTPEKFAARQASHVEKYPELWRKAGKPIIQQHPLATFTQIKAPIPVKRTNVDALKSMLNLKQSPQKFKHRAVVNMHTMNESVWIHEMGHLAKSNDKGTMNRFYRKVQTGVIRGKVGSKGIRAFMSARPLLDLKLEAEATTEAIKHARKYGEAAKHLKVLAPAYATYALRGVGHGLVLGGIGLAIKHQIDKRRKKEA